MDSTYHKIARKIISGLPEPLRKLIKKVWLCLQGFAFYLLTVCGFVPSHHFRRCFYRHIYGMRLGTGSIFHWQARFFSPRGISIGKHCNIGNNVFMDGRMGVTIGDCVGTGAEVMIYTEQHDLDSPTFETVGAPVVTSDVPAYTLLGGVPAKFIRARAHELNYRPDFAMPFQ